MFRRKWIVIATDDRDFVHVVSKHWRKESAERMASNLNTLNHVYRTYHNLPSTLKYYATSREDL